MATPFVSVIIPLYNGEKVVGPCVDSVLKSDYKDFEVLIIDDGSDDRSIDKVRPYLSDRIRLIENKENLGFGKTVNIGLQNAKGEILVLLNMDTVVDDSWLSELIKAMMAREDIGIAGSKIFYMDGKTLQHAGGRIDTIGRSYHIGRGEEDNGKYNSVRETEYVCGASIGIKKQVLEKIGNFDERFLPLYYEEIDFMIRAKKAGYRIIYAPDSRLRHHENYSIRNNEKAFYYISKNRVRFVLKDFSFRKIFREFIFNECRFFLTLTRDKQRQLFSAYLYNLLHLPEICGKRLLRIAN